MDSYWYGANVQGILFFSKFYLVFYIFPFQFAKAKIRREESSVSDPYWSQYGSGSSILGQYGSRSGSGSGFGSRYFSEKTKEKFFSNFLFMFFVTYWFNTLIEYVLPGHPGSSSNHQASSKMVTALFNLKSQIFPPFRTPIWLSWIRIRIPNTDPDPGEPFQYGSTWIRSRNTGRKYISVKCSKLSRRKTIIRKEQKIGV